MAVSRDPAFRTVRMRESYDLDAVDDFVDRVIDALEGKPSGRSLTPEKIEAQEFKVVRLREGYSMDDVDDWLDEAAGELRRLRAGGAPPPAPAQAPAVAPAPEPSYEQVGANHYGAAPAPPPSMPPPPVAYPLPEPQQPPPPPQYPQDPSGFGAEPTPGPDTAYHQLDPALRALESGYGGAPDTGFHDTGGFGAHDTGGFAAHDTGFADPGRVAPMGHTETAHSPDHVATPTTGLHHVEIWVRDLEVGMRSFGWLFERLGWTPYQAWDNGRSWQAPGDGPYVVIERSPDMTWTGYDRKAPGLNHLALAVPEKWMVDRIVSEATTYGWRLMFADQHPYAGGAQHYAAYLENEEGFEVEVVAP